MTTFATLVILSSTLLAEDLPQLDQGKLPIPSEIAKPLADALAPESYTIKEDGKEVLRFWIRKEIPSTGSPGSLISYDTIEDGTFIGVYQVLDDTFSDFRGQTIPVGLYTLRLATHPQDGNHMGIAPTPAFALLAPAADDQKLDPVGRDELMELSKKAAKTGHPCALYLEPFFEAPTDPLPRVRQNDLEHIAVDISSKAKLETESADLPLAIIFIGKTEAE
jgi:hypothetical protein